MKTEPSRTSMAPLIPYLATSTPFVHAIEVRVGWSQGDTLALTYTLTGDCNRLRIPAPRPQARVDGLWQHTCFEAFIAPKNGTAYWELNCSPSSEWAMYHFHRYRERAAEGEIIAPPKISSHATTNRFVLDTRLHLPSLLTRQSLRLGLSAVIEEERGQLSYWALQHPSEKPDFHHSDAFILEIPSVEMEMAGKGTR